MTKMRAKVFVSAITVNKNDKGETTSESVHFGGVAAAKYGEDGLDEDNTFAKFSPSVQMGFTIANPALFGGFERGDKFYVDFTPAE